MYGPYNLSIMLCADRIVRKHPIAVNVTIFVCTIGRTFHVREIVEIKQK